MGIAFEGEQVAIQAVERLVALNQELLDDLVHVVVHAVLPVGAAWCDTSPVRIRLSSDGGVVFRLGEG
jgi:hypothetical protein